MNFIVYINGDRLAEFVQFAHAVAWCKVYARRTEMTPTIVNIATGEACTIEYGRTGALAGNGMRRLR